MKRGLIDGRGEEGPQPSNFQEEECNKFMIELHALYFSLFTFNVLQKQWYIIS